MPDNLDLLFWFAVNVGCLAVAMTLLAKMLYEWHPSEWWRRRRHRARLRRELLALRDSLPAPIFSLRRRRL